MVEHPNHYARILGIDPSTRGFGFAVLEANGRLVDWGVAEVYSTNDKEFLNRIEAIIGRYSPAVVAVEDLETNTRRGERAKRRINALVGYAQLRNIQPAILSSSEVRSIFGVSKRTSKYDLATAIVSAFPELEAILPPKRKPWKSEDERMNIFDATGLALAGREELSRWRRFVAA